MHSKSQSTYLKTLNTNPTVLQVWLDFGTHTHNMKNTLSGTKTKQKFDEHNQQNELTTIIEQDHDGEEYETSEGESVNLDEFEGDWLEWLLEMFDEQTINCHLWILANQIRCGACSPYCRWPLTESRWWSEKGLTEFKNSTQFRLHCPSSDSELAFGKTLPKRREIVRENWQELYAIRRKFSSIDAIEASGDERSRWVD